jgi:hypothetical protein
MELMATTFRVWIEKARYFTWNQKKKGFYQVDRSLAYTYVHKRFTKTPSKSVAIYTDELQGLFG